MAGSGRIHRDIGGESATDVAVARLAARQHASLPGGSSVPWVWAMTRSIIASPRAAFTRSIAVCSPSATRS